MCTLLLKLILTVCVNMKSSPRLITPRETPIEILLDFSLLNYANPVTKIGVDELKLGGVSFRKSSDVEWIVSKVEL